MSTYLINFFNSSKNNEKIVSELSADEFIRCYSAFRQMHKKQLQTPTSANNYLLNFDTQCMNLIKNTLSIQMLMSGLGVYSLKHFFGRSIDARVFQYFGESRGRLVQIFIYLGLFFFG